ncbi:MAG: 5-formyltetrahydrofolate cyclo-ligase [Actinomycetes bacterium]
MHPPFHDRPDGETGPGDEQPPRVDAAKAELRRRVRAARRQLPAEERDALGRGIRDVALSTPLVSSAGVLTCYLSARFEPPTGPLRAALAAAGKTVLLPVVRTAGGEPLLDWAVDDGTTRPGPYASLEEPAGPRLGTAAIADADVVIVPALAVDTLGRRLGQGGGFYDRALLATREGVLVVAILHDDEVLDADVEAVPALPHDRLVDAVLTPTRYVTVRR